MSPEAIAAVVVGLIFVMSVGCVVYWKLPKRLNQKVYVKKWLELQSLCGNKADWRDAIIAADNLLDKALKQRKFKGSRPGERLVSAQRKFTNNDGVWKAHNLYKKLVSNEDLNPKEEETKKALMYFRQALRDLGALPSEQSKESK